MYSPPSLSLSLLSLSLSTLHAQHKMATARSRSFFQDISSRELNGFRVRKRPYPDDELSNCTRIGAVATEHSGVFSPPMALSFCKTSKNSHILAVTDEDGYISLYNTRLKFASSSTCQENTGRLRILKEAAKLQNVDNVVTTVHADLRTFADHNQVKSSKVLLDAPCSGLDVLSKRADLRWNRRWEDMEQLKALQDELLDAASMLVKPGGVLVYSTCSIDPGENEERVAAFLLRHPEFCTDPGKWFLFLQPCEAFN